MDDIINPNPTEKIQNTTMTEFFNPDSMNHTNGVAKKKKTGGRVKGSPYRLSPEEKSEKRKYKKKKSPLNAEHSSFTFLFFVVGKDEYTEVISEADAERRVLEIFVDPDYKDLQQIYFMKPLKLYNRPKMEVVNL